MADGALPAPVPAGWQGIDQAWELVEVELHQKARPRLVAALKTRAPHTARITYYVPAALHAALAAQLASVVRELGGRPDVGVELLPQVSGWPTGRRGVMPRELASRGPAQLGRLARRRIPAGAATGPPGAGAIPARPLYDNQLGHRLPTGGPPAQRAARIGVALGLFLLSPVTLFAWAAGQAVAARHWRCAGGSSPSPPWPPSPR